MTSWGEDRDDTRPRVLTAAQVRQLLSWPELIAACRRALIALAEPGGTPTGSSTQVAVPGSSLHLKAGALLDPPVLSVKANLRPDRGSSAGAILAFDHRRQRLEAIVASGDITAMRTGAIAAVAAQCLHPGRQPVVALVGAGPVAGMALQALRHVMQPVEVRIWSRDPDRSRHLAHLDGESVAVTSIAEATRGAGLVVTCTPAREPFLMAADVQDGAVVLAMGADSPGKRELESALLVNADIYVDVLADALAVGECAHLRPVAAGISQIGEVLRDGPKATRGRVTVFDSVGSAAVDAAAVALVLERANRDNVGVRLALD